MQQSPQPHPDQQAPRAAFTRAQTRMFLLCFTAYVGAYIARVNISVALPDLMASLGLSRSQGGLIATCFAITYAMGQVLTGVIVDRVSARLFIALGLLGSAAMNLLVSLSGAYGLVLGAWAVNGLFQSMLWTPILKTVALWFDKEQRDRVAFGLSITLILGYLFAWGIAGVLAARLGWRAAFAAPTAVAAVIGTVCAMLLRNSPAEVPGERVIALPPRAREAREGGRVLRWLFSPAMVCLLLCSAAHGLIRDSIMVWAPQMLMDTQGIDLSSALGVVLIIPLVNFVGVLFGRAVYRLLHSDGRRTTAVLMALAAAMAVLILLLGGVHPWMLALLLCACSAMMYAVNPVLTAMLPMDYVHEGLVGATAGAIDCAIYVGAGLAGVLTGFVETRVGWNGVFAMWVVLAVVGAAAVGVSVRARRAKGDDAERYGSFL